MIYTGCLYYVLRVEFVVISLRGSLVGSFSVVDISHGLMYVVYNINVAPGVKSTSILKMKGDTANANASRCKAE